MKNKQIKPPLQKNLRRLSTALIIVLFSLSLWQLAAAGWIQSKAVVAQQLLNYSWQQTVENTSETHKPWPWADTWPVAKLLVPQHDIEQVVLAGDSGSSLAFGPGLSFSGAMPNNNGTTIISGHRDTHFNFLKELKIDDVIYLQTSTGTKQYAIDDFQIVDSKNFYLQTSADKNSLLLVTCYPFDAITTGGSQRYLVYASQMPSHKTVNRLTVE